MGDHAGVGGEWGGTGRGGGGMRRTGNRVESGTESEARIEGSEDAVHGVEAVKTKVRMPGGESSRGKLVLSHHDPQNSFRPEFSLRLPRLCVLSSRSCAEEVQTWREAHREGQHAHLGLDASAGPCLQGFVCLILMLRLQFDYYNLPFCEPKGGEKELAENLGEVLAGERTETSAYQLHTNVSRLCEPEPSLRSS
eukprot:270325-Hanusia_phi.AAC.3